MVYDPEKYREKREKVLGIKKKGIGFGTLAMVVSFLVIAGLGAVTIPRLVSYMTTRNLDDAIFKLEADSSWPENEISGITSIEGVKEIIKDKNGTRLVVTYDRGKVKLSTLTDVFARQDLKVTLLNEVNHRQHQGTLKKEEEDIETP